MELHDAEEAMGITKIYAHDIMMTDKESTNQGEKLLDFYGFSWNYPGPKSNLRPARKFQQWLH